MSEKYVVPLGCDHVEGQGVAVTQRSPALAQRVSYWLPVRPLIGWPVPEYWAPIGQTHLRVLYEALGVSEAVTETGEHWQHHLPGRVSEHLRDVSWCHEYLRHASHVTMLLTSGSETEPVLVGASPEDGGSECLQGGSVVEHQVDVITW